jgi:hypothetical protein
MMTREKFISIIDKLEAQTLIDRQCSVAFSTILPNDYISLYDNDILFSAIIAMLKDALDDDTELIEYFIYDLDFGGEDIKNASELYDSICAR